MTRRWVLPVFALAALVPAVALASAKTYGVPSALGSALDETRHATTLKILLPDRLALDYDGRVYGSGSGDTRRYALSLGGSRDCGDADACFLATFSARRGSVVSFRRSVPLRGGRTGYFKPLTCGGSCSPPAIEWRGRGNVYSIQAKIPDSSDAGARRTLVAAANSAITAGPR